MILINWFKRYRHGKGFGIHSPFAFNFVRMVLKERLPYYDYSVIKDPRQRLVYRIACHIQPESAYAIGDADISPVIYACHKARIGKSDHQMVIASGNYDISLLTEALSGRCVLVVFSRRGSDHTSAIKAELDDKGYGMTFDNQRGIFIAVANPKLPRQDFDVLF